MYLHGKEKRVSIQESKWRTAESCEILKRLREGRPPALKLSAEAGADVGEEKASWKLCKGVEYEEIWGPWGVVEHMKKTLALKAGELQEDDFSVTWANG